MIYYVSYLKDSIGNNYLGIPFGQNVIIPFLSKLKEFIPEEYQIYIENQQKRDHDSYHCTVINVMEYNSISKSMGMSKFISSLSDVLSFEIDDLKMMGIGSASRNENKSFFIVCKSEKLNSIRSKYNLLPYDFHITIGFKWRDVFGVRKNQVISVNSKFIQILKSEFLKKENFEFVKKIKNFTLNDNIEVIPISISDNYLKVFCDGYLMEIGILDEDSTLYIMSKYKPENNPVRMPLTEIIKKLNNNGI